MTEDMTLLALSGHIAYNCLVSGSVSAPFQDTFQLSLTILVRYRFWNVFRVGNWYSHVRAEPNQRYSGYYLTSLSNFSTGVSPFYPTLSRVFKKFSKE